jgi:thiamine-phosphate pyrophosphorylase
LNLIRVIPAKGAHLLGRLHYIASYKGMDDPARTLALISLVLDAGVPCVQVRAKDCSDRQRYEIAEQAVRLCHDAGAICIINDRVDIALAVGADGAHVGPEDLAVGAARQLLGEGPTLGASARTAAVGREALAAGASYLGVGPCYLTSTKDDLPGPIGAAGLAAVAKAVSLPVLAIGGVTVDRIPELLEAGAFGIAVVGAIAMARDPAAAARELVANLPPATGGTPATGAMSGSRS